jgi:hypothetical protein
MPRKLIWIEEKRYLGWGCSDCDWVFSPSGSPTGNTLDEMLQNFSDRRDKEFAAHVCAAHPKTKDTRG